MKRFVSLTLVLVMLAACLSGLCFAADPIAEITNGSSTTTVDTVSGMLASVDATGNTVIRKDIDDIPYLSYLTDRAEDVWEWDSTLIEDDSVYFQDRLVSYFDTNAVKGFQSGRSLFIDINTINVAAMREMEDEFGIIPWPTYAEGETYLTNVDAGMHLFCLPITTPDAERTGLVLEALAILGHQTVIPEYMETTVKYKQTRDDESFEMLSIIYENISTDLALVFSGMTIDSVIRDLVGNNSKDVIVSTLQQQTPTFKGIMDTITTAFCNEGAKQYGLIE
jgi:hypothetical protein